jgi:hypothetical protein
MPPNRTIPALGRGWSKVLLEKIQQAAAETIRMKLTMSRVAHWDKL